MRRCLCCGAALLLLAPDRAASFAGAPHPAAAWRSTAHSTAAAGSLSRRKHHHTLRQLALASTGPGATAEAPAEEQQEEGPAMPVGEAKEVLLRLAHSGGDTASVRDAVRSLEAAYGEEPIATMGFFNLAVAGEWDVVHSTMYPKLAPAAAASSSELTVHALRQTVSPSPSQEGDLKSGEIVTALDWELPQEKISGVFEVAATYEAGDNLSMRLAHTAHRLRPSEMPSDPQALVSALQRHMPFELFDPHDQAHFTTYIDQDVRILWAAGGRVATATGARLIFLRRRTESGQARE